MKCPDCGAEMVFEDGIGYHLDFSGTAEDDELEYWWYRYTCANCMIINESGKWLIPDSKKPTDKQLRTLMFIENRTGRTCRGLTKRQCQLFIGKWFDVAKGIKSYRQIFDEEDAEALGLSEADFY